MDSLVNIIVGSSTTLDVFVLVKLIGLLLFFEFFAVICGYIGGMKK